MFVFKIDTSRYGRDKIHTDNVASVDKSNLFISQLWKIVIRFLK